MKLKSGKYYINGFGTVYRVHQNTKGGFCPKGNETFYTDSWWNEDGSNVNSSDDPKYALVREVSIVEVPAEQAIIGYVNVYKPTSESYRQRGLPDLGATSLGPKAPDSSRTCIGTIRISYEDGEFSVREVNINGKEV